jgi:hypothetical protein
MGGILSGVRGWRGGKHPVDHLPVAKLTHASTGINRHRDTYVRPEGACWATIVHRDRQWTVSVTTHALQKGGVRRWLVCPQCESKRVALYVAGEQVACRTCLGLRYSSQHACRRTRMCWRADKIRERLGWPPGVLGAIGQKPPGMHQRTYLALVTELEQLADAVLGNLGAWVERAEDRWERMSRR